MENRPCGALLQLIVLLLGIPALSFAEDERKNSIGIGIYTLTVDTGDTKNIGDQGLSGYALVGSHALSNNISLRGTLYKLDHKDIKNVEATGGELTALLGNNFIHDGFVIYAGLGYFDEKWKYPAKEISFSGYLMGLGLGYNFPRVGIDLSIFYRQDSDYQDQFGSKLPGLTVLPYSSSLALLFRF